MAYYYRAGRQLLDHYAHHHHYTLLLLQFGKETVGEQGSSLEAWDERPRKRPSTCPHVSLPLPRGQKSQATKVIELSALCAPVFTIFAAITKMDVKQIAATMMMYFQPSSVSYFTFLITT
jgi:hypothetical protein